jgi:hypothetical protein
MNSHDKPTGTELIMLALKTIKEGGTIDMLNLPDLTPEEEAAFARRNTRTILAEMLQKHGMELNDDDTSWRSDGDRASP